MYLYVVLLLAPWMVCGQPVSFTINSIRLEPSRSSPLRNGDNLSLKCLVDIAKSDDFEVNRKFTFYKDDKQIHSVNTTKDYVFYTIQRASVSRSGLYKCQVNMDGKQKTSPEVKVKVTGLLAPLISISKTEVSEGDEITVRCETNEEPPMIFKFFKEKEDPKSKQATNTNYTETTYVIKEGEVILNFECSVKMVIEDEPESPPSIKTTVTVVEPFTTPIITVSPSNNFTEGAYMTVTCTVQKSDRNSEKVTITLQKGNHILNASSNGRLTYSQVADVSDTGNYICKAEGKTASKTNSTMIKVKELFPRPRFTLRPMKNQTEYINDGDTVIMQCSVPGLPTEAASQQDFGFIDNKGKQIGIKRGGRLIKSLKETDSGSYRCKVTISNITKISEPVQVKVYAPVTKPELKQIVKGNKMVVLGDTLSLTCRSPSGTPPILYTLFREGEPIGMKEIYNYSEAVFMVNTTKQHDLGQYQCRASNRNLKSGAVSDALNVTVITPVREVSLVIIPKNGEVEEGAELSLVCKVENGTLPITFYFYAKKVVDVLLHNVTKTDKTHAEFILSPFTKQNDGSYYCTASNKANKRSSSESLEVKAVLARWKAAVIVIFIVAIVVAAIGIALYLYLDKKRKGKTISSKSARSTKAANSSSEKSAADVKTDDSYFGSVQNEEELHILKTTEENIGNNQQNHDVEYTEADGLAPDPHHDSAENNMTENPNVNNLT